MRDNPEGRLVEALPLRRAGRLLHCGRWIRSLFNRVSRSIDPSALARANPVLSSSILWRINPSISIALLRMAASFDHRVDDVLALFVIVFAFGIQVFDQCEDIGDVDYIAM